MNCPNCKKDLVTGFDCDNAACVDLRRAANPEPVTPEVKVEAPKEEVKDETPTEDAPKKKRAPKVK